MLVRYLHDCRCTWFALLLMVGAGSWNVPSREPMLRFRISHRVGVEPVTPAEVYTLIPTDHPRYTGLSTPS